jgi:hypothetical protein
MKCISCSGGLWRCHTDIHTQLTVVAAFQSFHMRASSSAARESSSPCGVAHSASAPCTLQAATARYWRLREAIKYEEGRLDALAEAVCYGHNQLWQSAPVPPQRDVACITSQPLLGDEEFVLSQATVHRVPPELYRGPCRNVVLTQLDISSDAFVVRLPSTTSTDTFPSVRLHTPSF